MKFTNLQSIPFAEQLAATAIDGPENLMQFIQKLRPTPSSQTQWSFFSKPTTAAHTDHLLLYVNNHVHLLIVTDGSKHYSYDIANGRSATPEVKALLGENLKDVSGDQLRKELHEHNQDFSALTHRAHPINTLDELYVALQNGYQQIQQTRQEQQASVRATFR